MTERSGIEIDYCPTCRGVWLDRGELDKIIERASGPAAAPAAPIPPQMPPPMPGGRPGYDPRGGFPQSYDDRYYDSDNRGYGKPYKKRRDNWLSELFD